ncbi:hypothetical protein M8J77_015062 [Diaphorina citri]|nr:hypothetical protein M8J77_015062 [Diaphorina citri]
MVRQRMRAFSWNDVRHLNIQGVTNYCSNQPIAALVVAGVAMLAVLPVLLGLTLFMLSLLTFTFMTLGIVMVSMMILMTLLTMFLVLFGLGYYFSYLKSNAERQSRRAHLN